MLRSICSSRSYGYIWNTRIKIKFAQQLIACTPNVIFNRNSAVSKKKACGWTDWQTWPLIQPLTLRTYTWNEYETYFALTSNNARLRLTNIGLEVLPAVAMKSAIFLCFSIGLLIDFKLEAVNSSETTVKFCWITRCHIPEDRDV